jgi:ADP-heptose:LPS heptosyltransferase
MHLLRPFDSQCRSVLSAPPPNPECLKGLNLPDSSLPRIILHPGGRDGLERFEKRWPISFYVELIQRLCQKRVNAILAGSGAEAPWIEKNIGAYGANLLNLAGKTTIAQLFELLRTASLFIGNNSGPMHMASALGIPIVTFSGGIPMTRWGPAGHSRNVVLGTDKRCKPCLHYECDRGGLPCLEAVSVDETWNAIARQMQW